MKNFIFLLLVSLPAFALTPTVCGRYVVVGFYSCDASSCKLKVYPESQSEMVFDMDQDSTPSVKKLTGKSIRAQVNLYQLAPKKMKAAFHYGAAMEYPEELGPRAFKLIEAQKCRP